MVRDLIGLPPDSPLWPWQPSMGYYMIDEGRFGDADLARRETLPALLFRLESTQQPDQIVALADAVVAWFADHPEFAALRSAFAALLSGLMGPLDPAVRVPEELSEVRNMLATRAETWKQQWLQEGRQEGLQEGELRGRQEGRQEGRREGRQEGEATLLLRLLERRFGALPASVTNRVAAAGTATLEEWSLRVLDAKGLDDVLR
jgi:hypothetical protein